MRNIVVDEYRASRSRDVPLGLEGMPTDESVDDSLREIELDGEFTLIREAFRSLPEDQRKVLDAVTVHGRKPSELTSELGRNAAAVSNLLRRAKLALRRATLVSTLRRGTPTAPPTPRTFRGLRSRSGRRTNPLHRGWRTSRLPHVPRQLAAVGDPDVGARRHDRPRRVIRERAPCCRRSLAPSARSRYRVVERGRSVISRALPWLTPGAYPSPPARPWPRSDSSRSSSPLRPNPPRTSPPRRSHRPPCRSRSPSTRRPGGPTRSPSRSRAGASARCSRMEVRDARRHCGVRPRPGTDRRRPHRRLGRHDGRTRLPRRHPRTGGSVRIRGDRHRVPSARRRICHPKLTTAAWGEACVCVPLYRPENVPARGVLCAP